MRVCDGRRKWGKKREICEGKKRIQAKEMAGEMLGDETGRIERRREKRTGVEGK